MLEQLYLDAFYDLYDLYQNAMKVHAGRDPIPKEEIITRNLQK